MTEDVKRNIEALLLKHFRGETTAEEEKELNEYLHSDDLPEEHQFHYDLFQAFTAQKKATNTKEITLKEFINSRTTALKERFNRTITDLQDPHFYNRHLKKVKTFHFARYILVVIGIIIFFFFFTQKKENEQKTNFAFINGKSIEDPEEIQKYAKGKIDQVKLTLLGCFDPFEQIPKLQTAFDKEIESIYFIKDLLDSIPSKLPIKIKKDEKDEKTNNISTIIDTVFNKPSTITQIPIQQVQ